jgi:hypothetical protein
VTTLTAELQALRNSHRDDMNAIQSAHDEQMHMLRVAYERRIENVSGRVCCFLAYFIY